MSSPSAAPRHDVSSSRVSDRPPTTGPANTVPARAEQELVEASGMAQRLGHQHQGGVFLRPLAWLWIRRLPFFLGVMGLIVGVGAVLALIYVGVIQPRRRAEAAELARLLQRQDEEAKLLSTELERSGKRLAHAEELLHYTGEAPALEACAQKGLEQLEAERAALDALGKRIAPLLILPVEGSGAVRAQSLTLNHQQLREALKDLQTVEQRVVELPGLFAHHQTLHASLLQAHAALVEGQPLDRYLLRADALRDECLESISNFGNLEHEEALLKALGQLRASLQFWQGFRPLVMQTEEAVRGMAEESEAVARAEFLAHRALECAEHQDETGARQQLTTLEELLATLQQQYTVRIVNIPSEYSRLWYNNAQRTGKLYYLVVEARDPQGNLVPLDIVSEQDHSRRRVTRWAERVDEATYEAVGHDKQDDGIIQQDLMAEKRRGYLEPTYKMGLKLNNSGKAESFRINRWPAKQ